MNKFFKAIKKGIANFGDHISVIVNSMLLTIVYIMGVGMTSLFAKLTKKHFLEVKLSHESYWSDLNINKKPLKEYYRQF